MEFSLTLFPYNTPAKSDGSVIPLDVVEKYLSSSAYADRIAKRLAFIGITHKDRKKNNSHLDISSDDLVLVHKNTVGFIKRMYIQNDGFVWADAQLFDPSKFSGLVKDDIMYLEGMLGEGVLPPVSAVIDAYWNASEIAKELISVDGADVTLGPAFEGAEIKSITTNKK